MKLWLRRTLVRLYRYAATGLRFLFYNWFFLPHHSRWLMWVAIKQGFIEWCWITVLEKK